MQPQFICWEQVLLPDKRAGKLKLQAAGVGRPISELYDALAKV